MQQQRINALCSNTEGHNFAACSNFTLIRDTTLYMLYVPALYGCSMEGSKFYIIFVKCCLK